MDRAELVSIFESCRELPVICSGSFNSVHELSPNFVVKFSLRDGEDATTWDYMEWCHLRLLKFGARSAEMQGFPIVLGVLNEDGMQMAVLGRCKDRWARDNELSTEDLMGKYCPRALATLLSVFEVERWELDLHSGNVMWCCVRDCLVLTDPFCDDAGTGGTGGMHLVQPKVKVKKQAQWMRKPTQHLYHMR
jgi:hypothetical protein